MTQGETIKGFLARLNPTERRFVVGVAVIFFLVLNFVFIWPHFADWGQTRTRMNTAADKLVKFEEGTNKIPVLEKEIEKYQKQGQVVPSSEQAVQFVRTIQNQASRSGVIIVSMTPQRQAAGPENPFFVEQNENVSLQSQEKSLVDFLYSLGAGDSLIRVKSLSVQPDQSHQQLQTRVTLVASYQKKPAAAAPAGTRAPAARTPAATPARAKPPGPAPAKPPTNLPGRPPGSAPPNFQRRPAGPPSPGAVPPSRNPLMPTKK